MMIMLWLTRLTGIVSAVDAALREARALHKAAMRGYPGLATD